MAGRCAGVPKTINEVDPQSPEYQLFHKIYLCKTRNLQLMKL